MDKILQGVLIAVIILGSGYLAYDIYNDYTLNQIYDFETCSKARGSVILEIYPEQCITRDGRAFTRELTEEEKRNFQPPSSSIEGWQTYRNKTLGFEFQYPSEWGELSLISTEGESYSFKSSNEGLIKTIIFHKPSKQLLFVEKRGEYPLQYEDKTAAQEIIKIILPNKETKIVYKTPERRVALSTGVYGLMFSPLGSYLKFSLDSDDRLFNINKSTNVFEGYEIPTSAEIFWFDGENLLFVANHVSFMSGDGSNSILISDYSNPETLNSVVVSCNDKDPAYDYRLDNVNFENGKVLFSLGVSCDSRGNQSTKLKYEYLIETKTFSKLP